MNLLQESIFRISEISSLIDEYGENIIITTLPICKYNNDVFMCKYKLSKNEIISLIEHNEKIIIYDSDNKNQNNDKPYEYRCAIVTTGGNINDGYPIELIEARIIDERGIRYNANEIPKTSKFLNPVSWGLIGKHDDGFVLRDDLFKGLERQTLIRIDGNEIVEAFNLQPLEKGKDVL